MLCLPVIGTNLKAARKRKFPNDDLKSFAVRICVSRATLQKMEKGDLSVSLGRYLQAAEILGLEADFSKLFEMPKDLFEGI